MLHGQEMPVVCMVAMDLTEHKRLEEALHQLNDDLEKRVQDRTAELMEVNGTLQTEIVERQRAEEALQESQALLRSVTETTPDLIFVKNRQSRIVMANPATLRLIGKPIEEVIGKDDRQHYDDPAVGEAIMANDRRIMESGQTEVIEEIVQTPEGYRVYLSTKTPYRNSNGGINGILGVARDITERKQAEEELQRHRNELELRVLERTQELELANEALREENEERLKAEIELQESESNLRELSSELLNAQEKERRLVAREIHDSLGSCLAAAKFKVESAIKEVGENHPQIRAVLGSVLPMLQETIQETRRIQTNLRPPMLDDLGILPTISWFCRQYESTYSGIRIRQEINIKEEEVAESLKTVIFRVLQEALNNSAKHSKASEVLLNISKIDRAIQLVIGDNGQGFDPSETHSRDGRPRGQGLVGMQERVELSGGSFAIECSIGKGTVIRASWPASPQDR
jgi:PAS domain S-box-containing protein